MREYPPNRNVLWAETLVDELAAGGLSAVCLAPGSRSTPLTVAFAEHDDVEVFSHLDERAAAYFALGRGRRTGEPTALVCTSGTAAVNFHPAVIEASQARVPLLVLTADRPPELRDSGANQTIDQEKLFGTAVRWYRDLPEPEPTPRKLRRLRTDAARALSETEGAPKGPVHLNCPFRKPLEPVDVLGDVPDDWAAGDERAAEGRAGGEPYVRRAQGRLTLSTTDSDWLCEAVDAADNGVILAGPADPTSVDDGDLSAELARLARATNFPILADPLSGLRFGDHVTDTPVLGGYDGYADRLSEFDATPDLVLRFGASMTSKPARKTIADSDARQVLVDPAGEWRDAEFVCSDLVVADPASVASELADSVEAGTTSPGDSEFCDRLVTVDDHYWESMAEELGDSEGDLEGAVLSTVLSDAPDPATVFVSNSMPIRDCDRFGAPRAADLTVLANRGASGIDGIVSTALGAGSATDDELVLVTGDLAYYHDMNGLLALARCDVDATIVCLNNDGGGIFHLLPIEEFDPPFTQQFKTPHGLDFAATGDLYDLDFERVDPDAFSAAYRDALASDGTTVVEVGFDSEANHRERERVTDAVRTRL
ncbi:2-succinyl-5-enolpyruvyl-6-hydroxy-3-cyclohexene-1-carboxylic-acid synthase [Haloarchaeobius sp. DFWS5]|uniref:2-succinyl-5-enolpyruvyl-6-hydroxy-3- cyclohexene-1-carboxylic-acid synthase n=1 Tax=Haloarchaeobius sp. DFWS5 TaxID=3446114 RepID=UPI003EBF25C6